MITARGLFAHEQARRPVALYGKTPSLYEAEVVPVVSAGEVMQQRWCVSSAGAQNHHLNTDNVLIKLEITQELNEMPTVCKRCPETCLMLSVI